MPAAMSVVEKSIYTGSRTITANVAYHNFTGNNAAPVYEFLICRSEHSRSLLSSVLRDLWNMRVFTFFAASSNADSLHGHLKASMDPLLVEPGASASQVLQSVGAGTGKTWCSPPTAILPPLRIESNALILASRQLGYVQIT
jgi:hypothetical protein